MQENAEDSLTESRLLRLTVAIENNNLEEVSAVLGKLGGYVNSKIPKDDDGYSPLHKAVLTGNSEILKLFSANEIVDLNIEDNDGCPPLHLATRYGLTEVLKILVDTGRVVLYIEDNNSFSALDHALENEHYEAAKILIEAGANCLDGSALTVAVKCNDISFAKHLISQGADVNDTYCDYTPLIAAAYSSEDDSHLAMMELFLMNGADVNAVENTNKTPLHIITDEKTNVETVELLMDYKADINAKDYNEETPLFDAVKSENVEIVQLLLDYGADVNVKNERGETPLFSAIECQNFEILQLLLDRGVDVHSVNNKKCTPLHWASYYYKNSSEIMKFLLKNGADANAVDFKGRTPLLLLIVGNSSRVTGLEKFSEFILRYLDVNVIDEDGYNLLDLTKNCCDLNVFLEHIAKLQALDLPIISNILRSISNRDEFSNYFVQCREELTLAKNTRIKNCWVTFFNLLTDDTRKLKNYAGNANLIKEFQKSNYLNKFPIYGSKMQKNMEKGIIRRKLYNQSSGMLSNNWPIFSPTHLVIRDILDCILSTKDLSKFCQ